MLKSYCLFFLFFFSLMSLVKETFMKEIISVLILLLLFVLFQKNYLIKMYMLKHFGHLLVRNNSRRFTISSQLSVTATAIKKEISKLIIYVEIFSHSAKMFKIFFKITIIEK